MHKQKHRSPFFKINKWTKDVIEERIALLMSRAAISDNWHKSSHLADLHLPICCNAVVIHIKSVANLKRWKKLKLRLGLWDVFQVGPSGQLWASGWEMPNHQEEALAPLSQTAEMLVAVHGWTLAQFPVTEVQNSNLAIFSVLTRKKNCKKTEQY